MQLDDELCVCFHVTWRKVINYARIHKIRVPSQLSECESAGTGCGWCRRALERVTARVQQQEPNVEQLELWLQDVYPRSEEYLAGRRAHIDAGLGAPPPD
ncbi:MAG: (2Fe-2S)-binding protein [Planctomycetales bacterium]|nr:(2Fe-2S)-binding protein [Planctomycetales bacterium]